MGGNLNEQFGSATPITSTDSPNVGSASEKIKLLVVDDHEVVRKGLAMVIGLEPDIEICCEAGSGTEAVEQALKLGPDLILMDFKMPGMNGVEAARIIKAARPQCKILILTGVDADASIFEALESGVDGYILKEVPPDELIRAIHAVASGEAYLHPAVTRKVLSKLNKNAGPAPSQPTYQSTDYHRPRPPVFPQSESAGREFTERLSERELEVLRSVALGRNNREIAETLVVGEETVRTHLKSAFRKLGVNDRTQAVVVALRQGLLTL